MANSTQDALSALEQLDARIVRPMVTLKAALTEMVSLEQNANELRERAATERKAADEQSKRLKEIKAQFADTEMRMKSLTVNTNENAQKILAEAQAQGDGYVAATREIIKEEKAKAKADADAKLLAAVAKLDETNLHTAKVMDIGSKLDAEIAAKRAELAKLNEQLDKAQAERKRILAA